MIMPLTARFLRASAQTSLLVSALWLSSCRTPPPPEQPPALAKKPAGLFEWNGEGKGISHIKINTDEQKAYLYQGKDQVGWTYVASGITSFPTPTGEFKVIQKVQNKVSNLYGKSYTAEGKLANSDFKNGRDMVPAGGRFEPAKMPYFMRLTNDGVGMHIGPIPKPGRRASHGCIRLPAKMAPIIFNNVGIGTPVSIVGSGPDYQTYLAQDRKKAAANAAKYAAAKKKAEEKVAADEAAGVSPATAVEGSGMPIPPAPTPNGTPSPVETTLPATPTPAPAVTPAPAPTEEVKPAQPAGQN